MRANRLWSVLGRAARATVSMSPLLVPFPVSGAANAPFVLRIQSEPRIYAVGDTIAISCTITNRDSVRRGFFLNDACEVLVFQRTTRLGEHYDQHAQRIGSPPYPTVFASLAPGEEWRSQIGLALEYGVIQEFPHAASKFLPPGARKVVHEGLFIRPGCDPERDEILVPDGPEVPIELMIAIVTCDPNPLGYSDQDCPPSSHPVEAAADSVSGRLDLSVEGELDVMDPDFERAFHLAMYCQHRAVLRRRAWIGRLESNRVSLVLRRRR